MKQRFYPMLFEPVYKDYIWGGNRIAECFNRVVPDAIVAESWEIADRPEGMSVVLNGPLAGKTLGELVRLYGSDLLGKGRVFETFPLLIKIIDAKHRLSLQVHPNDISACKTGGEPKTEAWFVLDAEPEAVVYAGFKKPSGEMEFREALASGKLEELLRPIRVQRGNIIYIPGGRVHCIGAGCLLLEIQQNSNTTYRVYDWGRTGNDGKPRELHLENAIRVIHWDDIGPKTVQKENKNGVSGINRFEELMRCPYFRVERIILSRTIPCPMSKDSFHVLFVERGSVRVGYESDNVEAAAGTSVLIPASMGNYKLTGMDAGLLKIGL